MTSKKPMMNMKCMKWMVYVRTYIQYIPYVSVEFFFPYIVIIPSYPPAEGYYYDSTVIAT